MADGTVPDIVRRSDALEVRAIRAESREVDFIASTEAIDSYDEIIDQASWNLKRFEKNPIILYQHDRWGLPIGQATKCAVVNGELHVTIKFATAEENPQAEHVFKCVVGKYLRAVSVGFKPFDGKYEQRAGRDVYVLYKCELREISVVTIPANEDCLAQMKSASLAELDEPTRERIRSAASSRHAAPANPSAMAMTLHADGSIDIRAKSPPELRAPFNHLIDSAKSATESSMDLKEATEKLEKSEKALVDAKASEKVASEKLAMTEEKLRALEAVNAKLTTEKTTLDSEHAKACTDRDTAIAKAKLFESKCIDAEVSALVGVKIAPTEKDEFVQLRTSDEALFKRMIEKRADMKLTQPVIADTETKKNVGELAPKDGDQSTAAADVFNSF